jgi:hypothetical protein
MKTLKVAPLENSDGKWVLFYETDRIDRDFNGRELSPIMCDYHVIEECNSESDADKALIYYNAIQECDSCGGCGTIYWGDSAYGCTHGLSLESRTFNGRVH